MQCKVNGRYTVGNKIIFCREIKTEKKNCINPNFIVHMFVLLIRKNIVENVIISIICLHSIEPEIFVKSESVRCLHVKMGIISII